MLLTFGIFSCRGCLLPSDLTAAQIERYGRQAILGPFGGPSAQATLTSAKVLIVGCGGLASAVVPLLAAAGVEGCIGLVDDDIVESSNLHRQVMHTEDAARRKTPKVDSSLRAIERINKRVAVKVWQERFTPENAMRIVAQFDLVVDCTDNLAARYVVNDACVLAKKPLISGAAQSLEGQVAVYNLHKGSRGGCYRCAFPTPPPPSFRGDCATNGVLGPVPALVGNLQALEAIKVILSMNDIETSMDPMIDHLMQIDAGSFIVDLEACVSRVIEEADALFAVRTPRWYRW